MAVFLSGESRGQKSLVGYNPWGPKRVRHDLPTGQQHAENYKISLKTTKDLSKWKARYVHE